MDSRRDMTWRQPSLHPRRLPADMSVSLGHTPTVPTSDQPNPPSTASPAVAINEQSSAESSDAGHWYEKTNNTARQSNAYIDNEPPFFLRNYSSSATPPEGHDLRSIHKPTQSTAIPHRPELPRRDTDDSSTRDFRSVIDDLTVANKKLKQKLRKYEKLHDAHLQDEKLFEVRFHGLPDHKKKELEEQLRKFAANLDSGSNAGYLPISYAPPLAPHNSSCSHTSPIAESGYASMSASGHNSTSQPLGQDNDRRKMSKSQYNQQQQSIRSYLHDIPSGLLPKRNTSMTDKEKKKWVVSRLEQIFAGKISAPGPHPQPMQQEEVAQSAAMADRRAKEATGQRSRLEGLREARIMPLWPKDDANVLFTPPEPLPRPSTMIIHEQDLAGSDSPDQRPTRPLDLDPYRAQVPSDNIQYFRHLGFTPPDMVSGEAHEEGHGWLYLNLLINMAQLHIINVTPEFVKEAVSEFSSKFELSDDGRKARWRGDQDVSMASSGSSPEQLGNSPAGVVGTSPMIRFSSGHGNLSNVSILEKDQQARQAARAAKEKSQGKFAYAPLFFHKDDSDDEDDFYNVDVSSLNNFPFTAQPRGDSSGFTSPTVMRSSSTLQKHDDGPIIFYNKAIFCTDLSSGDRHGAQVSIPSRYETGAQPLGVTANIQSLARHVFDISEPRGPMDDAMDMSPNESDGTPSSEKGLEFSLNALENGIGGEGSPEIMDFEASGLGGVQPYDNFAIRVRRSQVQSAPSSSTQARHRKTYRYPQRICEALKEQLPSGSEYARKKPNVIREVVLSISRKHLPSSTLPPASFLPFDSTSSGDTDSDLESDVSSGPLSSDSDEEPDPPTTLQLLSTSAPVSFGLIHSNASSSGEDDSDENSDEDSDDDSDSDDNNSVDFLATARKLDPKSVLASEREYDAVVADRLAELIPAGSSAATAGGGSGFNTPAKGIVVIEEDEENSDEEMVSTSANTKCRKLSLKRSRTSDDNIAKLRGQKTPKKN